MAFPRSSSTSIVSRSNQNLEVLVFVEGGKLEKNPRDRDKNQQQTQPSCDAVFGNRTWDTLVGGEHSHSGFFKSLSSRSFVKSGWLWDLINVISST